MGWSRHIFTIDRRLRVRNSLGPTGELPRIRNRRACKLRLDSLPHRRITRFFVAKDPHPQGVASTALAGALREIALLGHAPVESYPEKMIGQTPSARFLRNAPVSVFERHGCGRTRHSANTIE